MSLSKRLRTLDGGTPAPAPEPTASTPAPATRIGIAAAGDPNRNPADDRLHASRHRAQEALHERLGARLYDPALDEAQLRTLVAAELQAIVDDEHTALTPGERQRFVAEVTHDVLGLGPIERYLADPDVSEIMVNGTSSIYVERKGRLHPTHSRFTADAHLRQVIERIVGAVGRRIDESSPMVDARLADGSRVNAVVPPLAVDGPSLTIRKFTTERWGVDDLVRFGSLTEQVADLLSRCVEGRLNVLVSGGTGTGKTTLLNVLSSFIPDDERIVTIEDAVELQLQQDHVVRLESRPPNIEGRGQVEIRDLVRNALRMRPDRIIVGEVRGGEALDMLQAMNTGHDGSLGTLHANSPRDAVSRLETMVLMAGMDLPAKAIREQVASAVDVIVHLSRLRDGTRRVTQVTEVVGMEGQVVTLQDIFAFDHTGGVDPEGRILGAVRPTGIRPQFADRLEEVGITIPASLLGAAPLGAVR